MTAVNRVLTRALIWGAIVAAVLAVLGGGIGALVAGTPGLVGG
ncbi:3-oxoacyl-ACP reductase, partial [Schumannella sp. 10F1B-5-1]